VSVDTTHSADVSVFGCSGPSAFSLIASARSDLTVPSHRPARRCHTQCIYRLYCGPPRIARHRLDREKAPDWL